MLGSDTARVEQIVLSTEEKHMGPVGKPTMEPTQKGVDGDGELVHGTN